MVSQWILIMLSHGEIILVWQTFMGHRLAEMKLSIIYKLCTLYIFFCICQYFDFSCNLQYNPLELLGGAHNERKKRTTLADVAHHANSTATASRVLSNTGPVSRTPERLRHL
jgi:hypothetical protein